MVTCLGIGLFVAAVYIVFFYVLGRLSDVSRSEAVSTAPNTEKSWSPRLVEGDVTLGRACDLWGYDGSGTAVIVRQAAKGERYPYVGHDDKSTEILDMDGASHLWVVNRCAR